MPVIPQDRPIESLRSDVIDQLVMNYSHGEISLEAFERRLDIAMATSDHDVLLEQVADLDLRVDQDFIENKKEDISYNYSPGETAEEDSFISFLSDNSRSGHWIPPKKLQVTTFLSDTEIDLTNAEFTQRELRINIFSLLSSDSIHIPEGINVRSNVFSIFGSVDNSVSSAHNPNAPTVILEGFSILSSIDISVKRTLKERFVAFADKLKEMLS